MKAIPYLHIPDGKCREAFDFYKEALGGEVEVMTAGDSPMADQTPEGGLDKIMHASLKNGDLTIFGSDMFDQSTFKIGDNVSVCITCDSEEQLKEHFTKLSAEGDVFMEPSKESFGWFASFTDKYQVDWMLQAEVAL